jgi:polar amino acid transport system substrate-binding protein
VKKWVLLTTLLVAAVAIMGFAAACGGGDKATTTTAAATGYDINTITAGIKVDPAIAALVADKYKTDGIKVASDIPYPPWEFYVTEGSDQVTGFDYDLGQALGAVLGVKVTFVQTAFDSCIPSLIAGKNDIVMSGMYDNLVRRNDVDFVDYAFDGTALLVLKGNPEGITGLDSLAGKTVGCERGTTQAALLDTLNEQLKTAGKQEMTVNQYDDQPTALTALQSGRTIADLTDNSTAAYIAATTQGGSLFEVVVDAANPHGFAPQIDGIGVLKDNTQLRDVIQKALQVLIDNGTYTTIIEHYGLLPVAKADINQGTDPGN